MRRIQLPPLELVNKEVAKETEEKQEGRNHFERKEDHSLVQQNQHRQEQQRDRGETNGSPLRISIEACDKRRDDSEGTKYTPACGIQERTGSKECCTPKEAQGMACLCSFLRQDTALALTRKSHHPPGFDPIYHLHSYSAPPTFHKPENALYHNRWGSSPQSLLQTIAIAEAKDQYQRWKETDLRRCTFMQRQQTKDSPLGVGLKRPRSNGLSVPGESSSTVIVRETKSKRERQVERKDSTESTSSTTSGTGHSIVCRSAGCDKKAVGHGLCVKHGGTKRCRIDGCGSRAQSKGLCWKHGGYTFCKVDGCEMRAKARGYCWAHGGGTKCKDESCSKVAVSRGLCWAHGGGKRCKVQGCNRPGYQRNDGFCSVHHQIVK